MTYTNQPKIGDRIISRIGSAILLAAMFTPAAGIGYVVLHFIVRFW